MSEIITLPEVAEMANVTLSTGKFPSIGGLMLKRG